MTKVFGIVPARSGSKGFPNKNIAQYNGKSLLEWAVALGVSCSLIDSVFISTDSELYETLGVNSGATSLGLRSKVLSSDSARSIDVIKDIILRRKLKGNDIIVLLQPTSPIRTVEQLSDCIKLALKTNESVVTISKLEEPHPYKLKKIDDKTGSLVSFINGTNSELPRQSLPNLYQLTGAIYVSFVSNILERDSLFSSNTQPYFMNKFVNIDSELDFEFLKFLSSRGSL